MRHLGWLTVMEGTCGASIASSGDVCHCACGHDDVRSCGSSMRRCDSTCVSRLSFSGLGMSMRQVTHSRTSMGRGSGFSWMTRVVLRSSMRILIPSLLTERNARWQPPLFQSSESLARLIRHLPPVD